MNKIAVFRYFEFYKQEYYGLIKVNGMNSIDAYNKSVRLYVECVGGESVHEVKAEGIPRELTEEEALIKFLKSEGNENEKVGKLVKDFEEAEDVAILIDSSLI